MQNIITIILKRILPKKIRTLLRQLQKKIVYFFRRQIIRFPVFHNKPIKVILGAAMTYQKGWYSTNQEWLDIVVYDDWKSIFKNKRLLTNILAEHVFEHLTPDQMKTSLNFVVRHMKAGGIIRIAVPDGYNPDPEYIKHVDISGIGADAADHKQLLNWDTLKKYLIDAGLKPELKEGYLKSGKLIQQTIDAGLGNVVRSRTNDNIYNRTGWSFNDANTSLIVDGTLEK